MSTAGGRVGAEIWDDVEVNSTLALSSISMSHVSGPFHRPLHRPLHGPLHAPVLGHKG